MKKWFSLFIALAALPAMLATGCARDEDRTAPRAEFRTEGDEAVEGEVVEEEYEMRRIEDEAVQDEGGPL